MKLLSIKNESVVYRSKTKNVLAVNNVSFDIDKQDSVGIVGESGSGKSTLALALLKLLPKNADVTGEVLFEDKDLLKLSTDEFNDLRWKEISIVFQKSMNSLSPIHRIGSQMADIYTIHDGSADSDEVKGKIINLLEMVNLPTRVYTMYPHELSGGMMQRVSIALSLMHNPKLIIMDEATTALDVITQDYIFNLLSEIHEQSGVTMLLLTHDIAIVAKVADRIGVMYAGHLVEVGDVYSIFDNPIHPYTSGLLKAVPSVIDQGEERKPVIGSPPDLIDLPSGCPFHPRCSYAKPICKKEIPSMSVADNDHIVFCHKFNNHDYQ